MLIRLVLLDIDGVLNRGEAQTLDLRLLKRLATMNRIARENPSRPAVTLGTGRPAPYVEALLKAIDGHLPAIFENGAGLFVPGSNQILAHPAFGDRNQIQAVRRRLEVALVQTGRAFFQADKEYSITLLAGNPSETDTLHHEVVAALGTLQESVDLVYSASCLNILPRGIHKGKGVEFLASQTGYDPAEMLGVGDSDVDLPFLAMVGYSAAPANANPRVKRLAQYVAPRLAADGVRDILDYFGLVLHHDEPDMRF